MTLDEYIEKSLIAIAAGVTNAQQKANVTIAPASIEGKPNFEPQLVKFEVEVTTTKDAGGGINVLSLVEMKAGVSGGSAHRISFEVPVHFNSENVFKRGSQK